MRSACGIGYLLATLAVVGCSDDDTTIGPGGAGGLGGLGGAGGTPSGGGGVGPGGGGAGGAPACTADCSGHGTCVLVDDEPTCACESGYYRIDLGCLADPCESGGTCYYVDATAGDDQAAGTVGEPWQTLSKVNGETAALAAGSYVLFRRGESWADEDLRIDGATGTETAPITFGAYGPIGDARPLVRAVRVDRSEHVTLRDVESANNPGGPCMATNDSGYVIVQDVVVHDCQNNGIAFGSLAHHGVIVDSRVHDIPSNDALSIHSPMNLTEDNKVGDHFWVIDNFVPGPVAEEPIDVATGDDVVPGSRDVKIVGNVTARGGSGCIVTGHGTSVVWIVGNTLGECPTQQTAFALRVGGSHGALSGTDYQIRGNLIFWNLMSNGVLSEAPQSPTVLFEQNTIVTTIGERAAFTVPIDDAQLTFQRNLVWTTGSHAHLSLTGSPAALLVAQDHNWFIPGTDPACNIDGSSLADWQSTTGFDLSSHCDTVPGLTEPTGADVADFDSWHTPAFLDRFVADASWGGCADEIGAFDCSGQRRIRLEPIAGYGENGGLGWPGPLIVRQRYPLPD